MTISELERASGVPRSTIHYYVRQGLLPQPQKTADTRALYSAGHLALLGQIRAAKSAGRSLPEIRTELQPRIREMSENGVDLEARAYDRTHKAILTFATREFVHKGYRRTRVEDLTRELGISSSVFYAHFHSKRHLLVECFQTFIEWGIADTESRANESDDLIERLLLRGAASLAIHGLGTDVLSLVSTEALQGDDELRKPVQEAWDSVMQYIVGELSAMRPPGSPPPIVPDELLANSLNEAFQGTLARALWDTRYPLADVIRTHLWLWLAVRGAMRDPAAINGELARYEQEVRRLADTPPPVFPGLEE